MKRKLLITAGVIFVLFIIGAIVAEPATETDTKNKQEANSTQASEDAVTSEQQEKPETENTEPQQIEPLEYSLVEEKDISYAGCRRVSYKIKVADDANSEAVKATQQKLIDDKKGSWDDITVFTYNQSESDETIKNSGFTVDMAEYTACE